MKDRRGIKYDGWMYQVTVAYYLGYKKGTIYPHHYATTKGELLKVYAIRAKERKYLTPTKIRIRVAE